MMKNKLFILINVFGIGLGVALCILSYLNWNFRHDWDSDQVNAERIYRIHGVIFLLAALTVGGKTMNMARMNPVKALRDE